MLRTVPWLVPLAVVTLDQWAKAWARTALYGGGERPLLGRLVSFRLTSNSGALFGATAGVPQEALRAGLILVGVALCGLLAWMASRATVEAWPRRAIAFALVASGILSNTLDRALLGRVTDFLHFRLAERLELGTINVADLALFAGLLLLIPELFGSQTPRSMPSGPRIPRS